MRPHFHTSMLLAFVVGGLTASTTSLGQLPNRGSSGNKILEVYATHTSFEGDRRYLLLRVFTDGLAECESSKPSDPEHVASKKLLTKDEYARIKSIVVDPELAKVGRRYETWYAVVDTSTEWEIEIQRAGQTQVIQVLNFSPDLTKLMKHPYPDALVKLGCNVEKLRSDVLGDSPSLDNECKKVLGLRDQHKS
ncbi:MAG TPA: hypothetical protein VJN89_09875 [Candidatus Acidoferrum sp.]|nr:hypothetical protein [Candidatus Acidoferrum sp.]